MTGEEENNPYMCCTVCGRDTPVRASQVAQDMPLPRSRRSARAQVYMLDTLARNWRCNECLDEVEKEIQT